MSLATPIPLERLCRLAHVSRAGYYRWQETPPPVDLDLDLRDEIHEDRAAVAQLWMAEDDRRIAPARMGGQPQAGVPDQREAGSPLGAALPPPAENS